jgi:transposase
MAVAVPMTMRVRMGMTVIVAMAVAGVHQRDLAEQFVGPQTSICRL